MIKKIAIKVLRLIFGPSGNKSIDKIAYVGMIVICTVLLGMVLSGSNYNDVGLDIIVISAKIILTFIILFCFRSAYYNNFLK